MKAPTIHSFPNSNKNVSDLMSLGSGNKVIADILIVISLITHMQYILVPISTSVDRSK